MDTRTTPVFPTDLIKMVNEAVTMQDVQDAEMKALIAHQKSLQEKATQLKDGLVAPFNPTLVALESSMTLKALKKLLEEHGKLDSAEVSEKSVKPFLDFFNERAMRIHNSSAAYYPAVPSIANHACWLVVNQLAKFLKCQPSKLLFSNLKTYLDVSDKALCEDSWVILNEEGTYPISVINYLKNKGKHDGKYTVQMASTSQIHVMPTAQDQLNAAMTYQYVKDGQDKTKAARLDILKLLDDQANRDLPRKADMALYAALVKDLSMGAECRTFINLLPAYAVTGDWRKIVDSMLEVNADTVNQVVFKDKKNFEECVADATWYNGNTYHDRASLFFLTMLYKQIRNNKGYKYNTWTAYVLPIAYSLDDKNKAVDLFLNFLTSTHASLDAFIDAGTYSDKEKAKLKGILHDGDLGHLVKQYEKLQQPVKIVAPVKPVITVAAAPAPAAEKVTATAKPGSSWFSWLGRTVVPATGDAKPAEAKATEAKPETKQATPAPAPATTADTAAKPVVTTQVAEVKTEAKVEITPAETTASAKVEEKAEGKPAEKSVDVAAEVSANVAAAAVAVKDAVVDAATTVTDKAAGLFAGSAKTAAANDDQDAEKTVAPAVGFNG